METNKLQHEAYVKALNDNKKRVKELQKEIESLQSQQDKLTEDAIIGRYEFERPITEEHHRLIAANKAYYK